MVLSVTKHTARTTRHTTAYLACGPEDAPIIIFAHGWPELSVSWCHQLPVFAALAFRTIAPDTRGFAFERPPHAPHRLRERSGKTIGRGDNEAGREGGSAIVPGRIISFDDAQPIPFASAARPQHPEGGR